jgi:hypothetical protein
MKRYKIESLRGIALSSSKEIPAAAAIIPKQINGTLAFGIIISSEDESYLLDVENNGQVSLSNLSRFSKKNASAILEAVKSYPDALQNQMKKDINTLDGIDFNLMMTDEVDENNALATIKYLLNSGQDVLQEAMNKFDQYARLMGNSQKRSAKTAATPAQQSAAGKSPDKSMTSHKIVSVGSGEESLHHYYEGIKARNKAINNGMKDRFRTLSYDTKNPIETSIAEHAYYGKSPLMLGETGIGKTYSPLNIGKANDIPVEIIQLHVNSDSAELLGTPMIGSASMMDDAPSVYFAYGKMANAFKRAQARAKSGEPSILVLDEILRVNDISPYISNLTRTDLNEYAVSVPAEAKFAKVEIGNGAYWVRVVNDIDKKLQPYTMREGRLEFIDTVQKEMLCSGEKNLAFEMSFRGDLITMHKDQLRKLPHESIVETATTGEVIYVPESAIMIVATSNIGREYDVGARMDAAFFRRLSPLPCETPPIAYMVKSVLDKYLDNDWTKKVREQLEKTITTFMETIDSGIASEVLKTTRRINFSTIATVVQALDNKDPYATKGFGNIYKVMQNLANDFIDIDPSSNVKELKEDAVYGFFAETVKQLSKTESKGNTVQINTGSEINNTMAPARAAGMRP